MFLQHYSSLLLLSNLSLRSQLEVAKYSPLVSMSQLKGESDQWRIEDAFIAYTTNYVNFNVDAIVYQGPEDMVAQELSITAKLKDSATGQLESIGIGCFSPEESLNGFKTSVGGGISMENLKYVQHQVVMIIKYTDKEGNSVQDHILLEEK